MRLQRIQRKRSQSFSLPHSKDVSRISRWGNPFDLPKNPTDEERNECVDRYEKHLLAGTLPGIREFKPVKVEDVRKHLKGWNLACSCDIGKRCHADVLLWVANYRMKERDETPIPGTPHRKKAEGLTPVKPTDTQTA